MLYKGTIVILVCVINNAVLRHTVACDNHSSIGGQLSSRSRNSLEIKYENPSLYANAKGIEEYMYGPYRVVSSENVRRLSAESNTDHLDERYVYPKGVWDQRRKDTAINILSRSRRADGSLPEPETESSEPETEGENQPYTEPVATSETEPTAEPETIAENEPIPESEQQTVEETATFTTLMGLTILLILMGNVSVIIMIIKRKKLHTVTNLFILSMATADTCVALFVIPGTITSQFSEEYLGNILCKLCHYVSYSSTAVSGFALGAIALGRFRSLVFPLSPNLTNKQCTLIILATWALGFVFGFRVVFVYGMELETLASLPFMMCKPLSEMTSVNRYLMILDFVVIFFVPAAVIGIAHSVIAWKLGKKKKMMNTADENNARKRNKVVRMLMYLFSLYLVLHLPLHVYRLLLVSGAIWRNSAAPEIILMIIAFTNSWLNVICYAWMQGGIRHAFLEMTKLDKFYNKVNINKISPKSFTMGRLTTLNNATDTQNTQ